MASHFFAYLSRLKLIDRWSLMRCTQKENVQEHSHQVAMIAHALALLANRSGRSQVSPEHVAVLAIYHDATEVITGDLPTPVKYFSGEIRDAYKTVEARAAEELLKLLPANLRDAYRELLIPTDREALTFVKAADSIAAYLKCLEERAAGNHEFSRAQKSIEEKLNETRTRMPEVDVFLKDFTPSFSLTLDDLSQPLNL